MIWDPLADVGGGPWRVLDECPAVLHNTRTAWRAGRNLRNRNNPCICPRAMAQYADVLRVHRENAAARRRKAGAREAVPVEPAPAAPKRGRIGSPAYTRNVLLDIANTPDLSGGACRTPHGQRAMARAIDEPQMMNSLAAAKAVCRLCPLDTFRRCERWVMRAEDPDNPWGGVYAGMTVVSRQARRKREAEKARKERTGWASK